jgi:hypothetical protein
MTSYNDFTCNNVVAPLMPAAVDAIEKMSNSYDNLYPESTNDVLIVKKIKSKILSNYNNMTPRDIVFDLLKINKEEADIILDLLPNSLKDIVNQTAEEEAKTVRLHRKDLQTARQITKKLIHQIECQTEQMQEMINSLT